MVKTCNKRKVLLYRSMIGVLVKVEWSIDSAYWFLYTDTDYLVCELFSFSRVIPPEKDLAAYNFTVGRLRIILSWVGLSRQNLWSRVEQSAP